LYISLPSYVVLFFFYPEGAGHVYDVEFKEAVIGITFQQPEGGKSAVVQKLTGPSLTCGLIASGTK
jgi:hypothetical protein